MSRFVSCDQILFYCVVIAIYASVCLCEMCWPIEEGSPASLTCSTKTGPFESLGLRLKMDGLYHDTVSCSSVGKCQSVDIARYTPSFSNASDGQRSVTLNIGQVNTSMTRALCLKDGSKLLDMGCSPFQIYAKGTKPVCKGPTFDNNGLTATYDCTSERVFPKGKCDFRQMNGNTTDLVDLQTTTRNIDSIVHIGYKTVICSLHVTVTGSKGGVYDFTASVIPDLEGIPHSARVVSDVLAPLTLSKTAVFDSANNGHVYDYPSDNGFIVTDIQVTGNPKPHRFSLSVRHDGTSRYSPVVSWNFRVSTWSENHIELMILKGFSKDRDSFFLFTADNGVLDAVDFQYTFTIARDTASPWVVVLALGLGAAGMVILVFIAVIIFLVKHRSNKYRLLYNAGDYIYPCDTDDNESNPPSRAEHSPTRTGRRDGDSQPSCVPRMMQGDFSHQDNDTEYCSL